MCAVSFDDRWTHTHTDAYIFWPVAFLSIELSYDDDHVIKSSRAATKLTLW